MTDISSEFTRRLLCLAVTVHQPSSELGELGDLNPKSGKLSFYVAFKMLRPLPSISPFFCRTLSNWVYELDKWAPSVVKIAYKVQTNYYFFLLCPVIFFFPLSFLARHFGRLSRR